MPPKPKPNDPPPKEEEKKGAGKPDDKGKGKKEEDDKNKGKDAGKNKAPEKDDGKGKGGKDDGKGKKDDKGKKGKDDDSDDDKKGKDKGKPGAKPGKEEEKGKGGKDDKGKGGKDDKVKDDKGKDDKGKDAKGKGGKDDKGKEDKGKDAKGKGGKDDKGKDDKGKGGKDDKGKGGKDDKGKGGKNDKGKKGKDDDSDDDKKNKKGGRTSSVDARGRGSDSKEASKGNRSKTQPKGKHQEEEEEVQPRKNINPYIAVTEFYLGKYKAPICGADISEILGWKGKYDHLDINHAYFHWLFPHFQGNFGKERAALFRSNAVIGKRIIESYGLILDFYGIQIENDGQGILTRADNYQVRYKETFLRPFTNHEFRIKRMLQFLNMTGFRIYAINLVKFFQKEVLKIGKATLPPLKSLEPILLTDWVQYGEIDEKDKRAMEVISDKCLFPYEVLSKELNAHLKTLQ